MAKTNQLLLGETSGNFADSIGSLVGIRNGTCTPEVGPFDNYSYSAQKLANLSGVDLGQSGSLLTPTSSDRTWSIWFRLIPYISTIRSTLWSHLGPGGNSQVIRYLTGGSAGFSLNYYVVDKTGAIIINNYIPGGLTYRNYDQDIQYHNIRVTKGGSDHKRHRVFLDGVMVFETLTGPEEYLAHASSKFVLGNNYLFSTYPSMAISNFEVWDEDKGPDAIYNVHWEGGISDIDPPYFANQVPVASATGIARSSNIYFEIIDSISDVSQTATEVYIDEGDGEVLAYDYVSGFQNGYSGTVTPDTTLLGKTYYEFDINPSSDLANYETITVRVVAEDSLGNALNSSYDFDTEDDIVPVFSNNSPIGIDVSTSSNIVFDITDDGIGVNTSTINSTVEGSTAILNGVFQTGFDGPSSSIAAIANGYRCTIDPTIDLSGQTIISVTADAEDTSGNAASQLSWNFITVEINPPVVLNITPADSSSVENMNTAIEFDVIDIDSGVNKSSIQFSINSENPIVNGSQNGDWGVIFTVISNGYNIKVYHPEGLAGETTYNMSLTCEDLAAIPNSVTETWSFETLSEYGPDHEIKYNIYYKPAHRPDWILSNSEPVNHNIYGNRWVIRELQEGVTYHIAVVAGVITDGEWAPLADQSLVRESRGVGGLNIIKNHPYYVVKTFSSG